MVLIKASSISWTRARLGVSGRRSHNTHDRAAPGHGVDSGDSGGIHMQMEAAGALLLDANTTTAKCCCPNTMRMPGKILALHRIPRLFLLFHLNVLEDNIPR